MSRDHIQTAVGENIGEIEKYKIKEVSFIKMVLQYEKSHVIKFKFSNYYTVFFNPKYV